MGGQEAMLRLEREIESCTRCGLHRTRKKPVAGEGLLTARVMFIGEAPGFNEDMEGRPFVGKAGRVFDEMLESIGMERKDIYITNILKCRPPGNRSPEQGEINACSAYLDSQISIIRPGTIVTLGSFSMSYIFDKFGLEKGKISSLHGRSFRMSNLAGIRRVIPLYHPAVAVYNPGMKGTLLNDFRSAGLEDK